MPSSTLSTLSFLCRSRRPKEETIVDIAILEALACASERKIVGDLEDVVIRFIGDTSRDILEFSPALGTYQVRARERESACAISRNIPDNIPPVRRKCWPIESRNPTACRPAPSTTRRAPAG